MTEYDYTVRDGKTIVQFMYVGGSGFFGTPGRPTNGTGLNPKMQAAAGSEGAFTDLPSALRTWQAM